MKSGELEKRTEKRAEAEKGLEAAQEVLWVCGVDVLEGRLTLFSCMCVCMYLCRAVIGRER